MNNMSDGKADGLVIMYVKDGILYPVRLTQDQLDALDLMIGVAIKGRLQVFIDEPIGKAKSVL